MAGERCVIGRREGEARRERERAREIGAPLFLGAPLAECPTDWQRRRLPGESEGAIAAKEGGERGNKQEGTRRRGREGESGEGERERERGAASDS